ncbi:sodium channel protein Nach-like isoform X2 [Lycorma delicatula]|uniref:sodium channel protein Nach-like isoform X2 n=1 Tax=Lycorma delicatula TaxID=130591 RepID=UPI003F51A84A
MFKALKQVSTEFCLNSSIHGIRYVAESGRSFAEKLLWGCVILTNLTAAVIVVYMNSYDLSQLFIREHIKSLHYPTYVAPHPAYTFCPSNFQTSRANKFINRLSLPFNVSRADILEDLNLLQLLINTRSISNEDISSGKLHRLQTVLDYNFFSIELAIKQLIMPCSELFVKCVVGGILVNCSEMVIAIKTDIGFCCSVQSSSPYTINDLIYRKKLTKIIGTYGLEFGHSFILNLSINDQFYTKNPASGIQKQEWILL